MHDEFEMSMMGELNFFLGLQIKQMEDGIFFNQSKYIKEMLKKFGLEDSKPMKTPMSSDTKLTKDEECESVDSTKYRGMIGSLLYLTASRPDIMFSVCLCARFQEAPKTSHLEAFSKKQTALAISTTEAKYVSAGKACQQALWMKQALIDYDTKVKCFSNLRCIQILFFSLLLENFAQILDVPLAAQLERKPRRDRGMRRGRHSTSSSPFDQLSLSHLNDDDDDDGNDEGTSRASTLSLIRYVNSSTNQVPQVFQNPPNIDPHLEPFYTRQTKIINHQVQLQDEHRGGVRSIGKSLRRLWRNMKK
ncbi:retrovirus-related pol polyprotein from transposon TNT 1-94 [Tanacetum coccineum]